MWGFVIVICHGRERGIAWREELEILSAQNLVPSEHFLVVESTSHAGRGSGFLNALLLTIEKICRAKNISNVSGEVLRDCHILVLDEGDHCCYWPFGNALLPTCQPRGNGSGLRYYLQLLVEFCLRLKEHASPGVWVVSCDFLLNPSNVTNLDHWVLSNQDAVVFTTDKTSEFTKYVGSVIRSVNNDGIEEIRLCYENTPSSNIPEEFFSGIIYFSQQVVQILGSLISDFPINICTYLGEDMGHRTCQISFYDVIAPLCEKKTSELGFHPDVRKAGCLLHVHDVIDNVSLDEGRDVVIKIRETLWDKLHGFKASAYTLSGLEFTYLTMQEPIVNLLSKSFLKSFTTDITDCPHSGMESDRRMVAIDSMFDTEIPPDGDHPDLKLIACKLSSKRFCGTLLANNSYLVGLDLCLDDIPPNAIKQETCIINFYIELNQEFKKAYAVFSVQDAVALDVSHPKATVFGLQWEKYLLLKGIDSSDIWTVADQPKSLLTAKLYPLINSHEDWLDFVWVQDVRGGSTRAENWRSKRRFSVSDFLELTNHAKAVRALRNLRAMCLVNAIEYRSESILPYLPRALAEDWVEAWLDFLDAKAASVGFAELPRFFISISEILASMAGNNALLRSGPAMHKDWMAAFNLLENHNFEAGVQALRCQRLKWMKTPEGLIRSARHYERAAQIIVKLTIDSVQNYVPQLTDCRTTRPEIGTWIESECPVRLDLAGGWSDTPPICYEIGGVVINVSIIINGKKPMGARGRRISELKLVLGSDKLPQPLSISSIEELDKITDPSIPGALIKAALLAARAVDLHSGVDLPTQLKNVFGGGLELHVWSNVPQGSGLGTSSILAGALLAVVYTAIGVHFTRSNLVHAVLLMEQLMTTGGGWQDQVSGIFGGCNRGYSFPNPNVRVFADKIELTSSVVQDLNSRLVVLFTGQARLARNLLQGVIRRWYTRDRDTLECFRQLVANANECQRALEKGDMIAVGEALNRYWSQKKDIAPGCEPSSIKIFMDRMSTFVIGQSLAGAGGGGFYSAILKDPNDRERCKELASQYLGKECWYPVTLDFEGISLRFDGCLREINP